MNDSEMCYYCEYQHLEDRIKKLEEENAKLKKANKNLRDKLNACHRERNQMHKDSFESVDFGDPYDR